MVCFFQFFEMASQLRIAIVTFLLFYILMEDTKPVLLERKDDD